MPNAEGRAATKRAPAKKAAPSAAPIAPAEGAKPERHVRTPLERAQSVYDRAKVVSDKIATRLATAEQEVATLKEEAKEAKVTLDWAASHPLLVKARAESTEGGTGGVPGGEPPARDDDYTEAGVDASAEADADSASTDAATEEGAPTGDSTAAPVDVFEQGEQEPAPAEQPEAPFPFDKPAAPEPPNGTPFDFDQARITRV